MIMNLVTNSHILSRRFSSIVALLLMILVDTGCAERQVPSAIALSGSVSSSDESIMEGVVVILQPLNSPVLIAVTSDAAGQFKFNRDRLAAGEYRVSVRAAGYELQGAKTVVIGENQSQSLGELYLTAVTDPLRLASQLTSLDWVNSFPGSEAQKDLLVKNMVNCGFCHSL